MAPSSSTRSTLSTPGTLEPLGTPEITYAEGPVVVGAGLAGLLAATALSPVPVTVISPAPLGVDTSTGWAQGGIAAAVGPDDDPALHAEDTLRAGAGLCDPEVVRSVTDAGPEAISWLLALGARFDRERDGALALGLEGAHCRRRVLHAAGDGSGAELLRVAVAAARRTPSVTVVEGVRAVRVLTDAHGVAGVIVEGAGPRRVVATRSVVLATGGLGGLYAHTTNPLASRGQGLALAVRAGAVVRDVELVQFHPTALDVGLDPMPLVSEAVRGEGATLVTASGAPAVTDPLAARDVVARALWAARQAGHATCLDARATLGPRFGDHFPAIESACRAAGLDPAVDLLPVRPAAHYAMGGVLVDAAGRTTVPGLWAVGECASTGLHGANRLASNSLLEATVCSRRLAATLRDELDRPGGPEVGPAARRDLIASARGAGSAPQATDLALLRSTLEAAAGVLRDAPGLQRALGILAPLAAHDDDALVAALVCRGALQRTESRGAHTRTDHPATGEPQHTLLTLADVTTPTLTDKEAS